MSNAQLNPERVSADADATEEPSTMSGRVSWRLARGPLSAAEAERLGVGRATLNATVYALRHAGWTVETDQRRGDPNGTVYRVTARPNGTAPPAEPLRFGTSAEDQLAKRDRNAARSRRRAVDRLLAPAPVAPAVGTVLRVTMLTENDGAAVLALTEQGGAVWFVRVEGQQ